MRYKEAPEYVTYRRQVRRVIHVLPAVHGRHRRYILGVTRAALDSLPPNAHTTTLSKAWGKVGVPGWPAGSLGVVVRSDHAPPFNGTAKRTGKRGRPRLVRS